MDANTLVFEANIDQLTAFSEHPNTRLVDSISDDGRVFIHCFQASPDAFGWCEGTSHTTVRRISAFLDKYRVWFENSDAHARVLNALKRAFPKRLSERVNEIKDRILFLPRIHPIAADFEERQDVRITLAGDGSTYERWAHSAGLKSASSYFRKHLGMASTLKDGGYDLVLPEMPEAVADFALRLLQGLSCTLPRDVTTLCSLYQHSEILELMTGKRSTEDACLHQLQKYASCDDIPTLLHQVTDWGSDLAEISLNCTAQHFVSAQEKGTLKDLPPEAMLRILSNPLLRETEDRVLSTFLKWLRPYCRTHAKNPCDFVHEPIDGDRTLLSLLRFEHLTLSRFAELMTKYSILTEGEFQEWYHWLAAPNHAVGMPRRPARLDFFTKTSNRGNRIQLYWQMPVEEFLKKGRGRGFGIQRGAESPTFRLGGDQWKLEFVSSPYGPHLLGLRRLLKEPTDPYLKADVDFYFPGDQSSDGFTCIYSRFSSIRDKSDMAWQWLERIDPVTGLLPVEITIDVEAR